ncbi:MAG: zf-HC2 domain-containing protein [Methylococcaceae bacterium]|nr:zf-HC2 domain-containing protein [Methylococcaceae bacterium]
MPSCREITFLISKGLDKESNLVERLAVGLHVLMCDRCRNYQTQSQFIQKAAHRYSEQLKDRLEKNNKLS